MQTVMRGFAQFSTSVAIAVSIWLLRKRKRWSRLRMAWGQRGQPGQAPPTVAPAAAPVTTPRSTRPVHAPLDHIEVVEDSDWQVWEAAVSSQHNRGQDRAASS